MINGQSSVFYIVIIIIVIKYYENFYATKKDIKLEGSLMQLLYTPSYLKLDYKMTIKREFKGQRHRQK